MSSESPIRDERDLAERLRREAIDARPEFSETLHARICRAVRECLAADAPERRPRSRLLAFRRPAFRWAVGGLAAACLAAAAAILWGAWHVGGKQEMATPLAPIHTRTPPDVPGPAAVELPPVTGLTNQVSAEIPSMVSTAMASRRWAYLDHDARLAMDMLIDRLPVDVVSSAGPAKAAQTP